MFEEQQKKEAVGKAFLTDVPSMNDHLGFKPYVEGLARFISDPSTKAPLTISVEGEWGSGKSSFLKQLQEELTKLDAKAYTVWFDSWRYDKEDSMWAAFSLSFLQQVSEKCSVILRPWLRRKLKWKRRKESKSKIWSNILKKMPIWFVDLIFLTFLIVSPIIYFSVFAQPIWNAFLRLTSFDALQQPVIEFALKMIPLFPWLITVVKEIRGTISGLLESSLNKYINNPNYEEHIQLLDRFHTDFRLMIENYVGNSRVYIFVDDLDRCEAGKAAELMQAINMMIHDTPEIIFVIAMDRKKIAAGYAMQHEKVLPFLLGNMFKDEQRSNPKFLSQIGLEYGYSYIEKFIQVSFSIPKPSQIDVYKLLGSMKVTENTFKENTRKPSFFSIKKSKLKNVNKRVDNDNKDSKNIPEKNSDGAKIIHQDTLRILLEPAESATVRDIIVKASNYLDYNPRKIKQFVNMFRLYAYLADGLGFLQLKNTSKLNSNFTLEQLGKIVVINLKWPQLITEVMESKQFIHELLQLAYEKITPEEANNIGIWKYEDILLKLLKEDCKDENSNYKDDLIMNYGFNENNFLKLFKIGSPVFRLETYNVNSSQIILKDLTGDEFARLIIEVLKIHFSFDDMKILREEWWGKDILISVTNEESIIVDIEMAFDTVDVHSIESVKEIMNKNNISKGLAITPYKFEGLAISYSRENNIELWDGTEVVNILKRYGYNVG